MKVLLSTPPGKTTELWPPLGPLYIASSLRSVRDDEVKVIDAYCENLGRGELVSRVVKEMPDVFGMNCSTHTFLETIETLREVRELLPQAKLVLGGFHATFAAERILSDYPFVDYIVKGEAEQSFPELVARIESGASPSDVEGICYSANGRTVVKPPALVEDLDSLPFPARDLVKEVEYGYFHQGIRLTFGKFTTLSSSRGCPYSCTYCSCAAFSEHKWRARSPENVVDELEHLYGEGYECVVFVDDNLTHDRKRIEKICDLIQSRRIKMRFYCEGRADSASFELMRKMKRAGFGVVYFGVESPQEHVLQYYKKTVSAEQAERAILEAKRAGLLVVTSYIVGAPVESLEDMKRTEEFIRKVRPHALQVNILDCLIGTEIWAGLEGEGVPGPDDWKTNHRIYEYSQNGMTKEVLEGVVNRCYNSHLEGWKTKQGAVEILNTLLSSEVARSVVLHNILRPEVRQRISDGSRYKATAEVAADGGSSSQDA